MSGLLGLSCIDLHGMVVKFAGGGRNGIGRQIFDESFETVI